MDAFAILAPAVAPARRGSRSGEFLVEFHMQDSSSHVFLGGNIIKQTSAAFKSKSSGNPIGGAFLCISVSSPQIARFSYGVQVSSPFYG